jgi:putative membrane protein
MLKKCLIILLSLFIAIGAYAQQRKSAAKKTTTKKATPVKHSDNAFILKNINADLMHIEMGGHAEKNATDKRVKDYGSIMVRDHRRTKTELKSIASLRNLALFDAMDAKHRERTDELKKKTGTDFDKHYIDMMVNEHSKDLAEFKRTEKLVRDKELKEFMPRAIILVQTHLDSAKAVQAYLKGIKK